MLPRKADGQAALGGCASQALNLTHFLSLVDLKCGTFSVFFPLPLLTLIRDSVFSVFSGLVPQALGDLFFLFFFRRRLKIPRAYERPWMSWM